MLSVDQLEDQLIDLAFAEDIGDGDHVSSVPLVATSSRASASENLTRRLPQSWDTVFTSAKTMSQ